MEEVKERVETSDEKLERCDGYVDFGALHRGMMLRAAAWEKVGGDKDYEEVKKTVEAFSPEQRDKIYLDGLKAEGMDEKAARNLMERECRFGDDNDPWVKWYAEKMMKNGVA